MSYAGGFTDVNTNKYPPHDYAEVQATANTTTSSSTFALLNTMTVTPVEGTHVVNFTASTSNTGTVLGTISEDNYFIIYVDGVAIDHTERISTSINNNYLNIAINCLVTVNGTQDVQVYWRTTGGTATCYERTLTVIKLSGA